MPTVIWWARPQSQRSKNGSLNLHSMVVKSDFGVVQFLVLETDGNAIL